MVLSDGAEIRVKNKDGSFSKGVVLNKCDFGDDQLWWIKYGSDTSVFEESQLLEWNRQRNCECGSDKVGTSNRHAYFCPKYE